MLYGCIILCCPFILITIFLVYFFAVKVYVGVPPVKRLLIAYKYCYSNYNHSAVIKDLKKLFPDSDVIKICYCGIKANHVEYATGVILKENCSSVDSLLLESTFKRGYSLFITPEISHSVYTDVMSSSWFPFSYILATAMSYPRLFSFIESRRLCGYPVLEVYKETSLSVIVPLIRQDEFVVNEALAVVNGHRRSALLTSSTPLPPSNIGVKLNGEKPKNGVTKNNLTKNGLAKNGLTKNGLAKKRHPIKQKG